jgi:antirestriction protein ArdC
MARTARKQLTPEERDAATAERKAAVAEVTDQLTAKIEGLVTSEDWKATLDVAAKFHNYSLNNVLWLMLQGARRDISITRVAGFQAWIKLGRTVKKGETSLRVLAPSKYKIKGENGEADRWIVKGFTLAPVFDISQTEGDDIPQADIPKLLDGDGHPEALAAVIRLVEAAGFTYRLVPASELGGANGVTNFRDKVVDVRDDLSPAQTLKTSVHEYAHTLLHAPEQVDYLSNRGRCETEAESVAYVVLNHLGIETDDYSLAYVAGWSGGDAKVVRAAAEIIIKTAHAVIESLTAADRELVAA